MDCTRTMIGVAAMRRLATFAVLGAMAMVVLDAGMTAVALPTTARALGVPAADSILVAGAYQLALLAGLLPAAHLASRFGQRRLFVAGVLAFTAASAMAALAPDFGSLVAARFVQGLGGSAILALGIALLRFTHGTERLGSAIAWNALNVALCAAAGPAIGALLLVWGDWRWLFLVNLPLGFLVAAASSALPRIETTLSGADWAAVVLHAAGATMLFLALHCLATRPAAGIGLAALSAASLTLLVRRDRSKPDPLVPLDLLGNRQFRLAVSASVCCFVAQSAGLLAIPFYLQLELSKGPLATGLVLAGWPIAVALTSPWVNRLAERHGSAALCGTGASFMAAGLFAAALLPAGPGVTALALCTMVCGVGFALFQVPNNRNLFLAAPADRSAAAGGMQGTARLTGQTLGALLVGLAFASPLGTAMAPVALAGAAAFALAAALISLRRSAAGRCVPMPCEI